MKLKLLTSLLIVAMLICALAFGVNAAEATPIGTPGELAAIMADSSKWAGSYKLTANIDLTGQKQSPIGNSSTYFTGTFDGDGHEISGLSLVDTAKTTGLGLFGAVKNGTIKNLTVRGTVTSNGNRIGGIVGYAFGTSVVIENCTSYVEVTQTVNPGCGGILGTILESSAKDVIKITKCTNYGNVNAYKYGGGIVGNVTTSNTANKNYTILIDECVNYGAITNSGGAVAGGIMGFHSSNTTGGTNIVTISNSSNYGKITSTSYSGGIVGALGTGTNRASLFTCTITNCYNEGDISGTVSGGIAGLLRPAHTYSGGAYTFTNVMSADSTKKPILGGFGSGASASDPAIFDGFTNMYTAGGTEVYDSSANMKNFTVDDATCYTSVSSAEDLAVLAAQEGWVMSYGRPELELFHAHVDDNTDGSCDGCGAAMSCAHANQTVVVTKEATCTETGLSNTVCADCEFVISSDNEIAINPNNHASDVINLEYDETNACINYKRPCCNAVVYTDTTVDSQIYVSTAGVVMNKDTVINGDVGSSATNAFADFEFAMEYAGIAATVNGSATVNIVDKATVTSAGYESPVTDGMITITGGELCFATDATRFWQFGPITVKNTAINNAAGVVWGARNNKVVMGEGITHASTKSIYLLGGWQASKEGVGGEVTADITVRSGEWYAVAAGNRQASLSHYGDSTITVGTVNDTDTLTILNFVPFHITGGDISKDSTTTIIVDGKVNINNLLACNWSDSSKYGKENTFTTNLVLKEGADILTDNALNNYAPESTVVWNVYADQDNAAAVADAARIVGADNITVNQYTYMQYCANVLGGHFGDGDVCTECGASTKNCEHANTTEQIATTPTCAEKGSANVVCNDCGETVGTKELDIDAANHVGVQNYVWTENAETGEYEILCVSCGKALNTSTELPTVYVSNYSSYVGDDEADGLTAATAVKTLVEAVERIKNVGGTVRIVKGYSLKTNTTLPDWNGTITFTSDSYDTYGAATAGFNIEAHNVRLYLGGEAKFDAILFKGTSKLDATYTVSGKEQTDTKDVYRAIISANWHDVDFGYVRSQQFATIYLVAGNYGTTEDDNEPKTTNITIDGPALSTNALPYFYERVYLGTTHGSEGIDAANKTVNFVAEDGYVNTKATERTVDTVIYTIYAMSTSQSRKTALSSNCTTTVTLKDNTGVVNFRTGDGNVKGDAALASLDSLTVNFLGNSHVADVAADSALAVSKATGTFQLYNVKNTTINVSTEKDGRTEKLDKIFYFYKAGSFVDEETAIILNADSHCFVPTLSDPIDETYGNYSYTVVKDVTDVCTWDGGKVTTEPTPDNDGVMTYTCEVCGRTKTESIAFVCTTHNYVAKADGTYVCTNGCAVTAPTEPVVVSVAPAEGSKNEVTVTVSVNAATPIIAHSFVVNAPEGFTLKAVEPVIESATPTTAGWAFIGDELIEVPYKAALINMAVADAALNGEVAHFTFTVADTVEEGKYVFTVDALETYNINEDEIETASVDAEISYFTHEHEYEVDALESATVKYVCTVCDSVKTVEAAELTEGYKYGISATLTNELVLEYPVQLSNELNASETYIKVVHYGADSSIAESVIVKPHKTTVGETVTTFRFYAPGVAGKEMNDRIEVTLYALVDGEFYVAPTVEKNIVDYYNAAYKAYGEETRGQAPALMNTLYALLNYGAAAQEYFEYNASAPVNAVLPADKQMTVFEAEASDTVVFAEDCENDAYKAVGLTPFLEDRIVLAVVYNLVGEATEDLKFVGSYTDINGSLKTFELSGDNIDINNVDGEVVVYVDVVAAKDLRQMITGALYSGETKVSDSISFSFECYASVAKDSEKNICAAILNYADAAKALFYKEAAAQ